MLENVLNKYKIILGSQSPRRQQFLKELNIPFEIRTTDAEEIYPHHYKGNEITEFLAQLKSNNITLNQGELLITSDTIVWSDGKALGKPKDAKEAVKMIKSLSNKTHDVISSVCLASLNKTEVFSETTKVTFGSLSNEEIEFYVKTYKPMDKAGSYGIQEWIGHIGVTKIEGTYANVVGLPVQKLFTALKNF